MSPNDRKRMNELLSIFDAMWNNPETQEKADMATLMASGAVFFMLEGRTADAAYVLREASKQLGVPVEMLSKHAEGIRLFLIDMPRATKGRKPGKDYHE